MEPYDDWKYRFVRVRWRDGASMMTAKVTNTTHFPLSWTTNHRLIKGIYSNDLSPI